MIPRHVNDDCCFNMHTEFPCLILFIRGEVTIVARDMVLSNMESLKMSRTSLDGLDVE